MQWSDLFLILAAGFWATLMMTFYMALVQAVLPEEKNKRLPSGDVAMSLAEKAGLKDKWPEAVRKILIAVSHFGYGLSASVVYGFISVFLWPVHAWTGIFFGLSLWAVSYLGWLPLFKVLPPVSEQSGRRNFLLISAHGVWGLFLGATAQWLSGA